MACTAEYISASPTSSGYTLYSSLRQSRGLLCCLVLASSSPRNSRLICREECYCHCANCIVGFFGLYMCIYIVHMVLLPLMRRCEIVNFSLHVCIGQIARLPAQVRPSTDNFVIKANQGNQNANHSSYTKRSTQLMLPTTSGNDDPTKRESTRILLLNH